MQAPPGAPPGDPPATWADLFDMLGILENLQSLSITGNNTFNGTLLPRTLRTGFNSICQLARAKLSYLTISVLDSQANYVMHSLTGTLPACLIDSRSQIRLLSIGTSSPSCVCFTCKVPVEASASP